MADVSVTPSGNARLEPNQKVATSTASEADRRKRREDARPGWFTSYYWLWRRSASSDGGWQEFLRPPPGVVVGSFPGLFAMARDTEAAKASTGGLQERPGIYEFAIAQPKSRSDPLARPVIRCEDKKSTSATCRCCYPFR
jgi:hypothetical protein